MNRPVFSGISDAGVIAGSVVAVVGAVGLLSSTFRRAVVGVFRWFRAFFMLPIRIEESAQSIAFMRASQHTTTCALGLGWWESDLSGRTLAVNLQLCRFAGRTRDEFLGMEWMNVIHPDDRDEVRDTWLAAIADRRQWSHRMRLVNPEGESTAIVAVATPVEYRGQTLGYVGSVTRESA